MAANASAQKSRGDLAMDAGNKALKKSGFSSFFSSKVISFNGYGDRLRSPQPAATETSVPSPSPFAMPQKLLSRTHCGWLCVCLWHTTQYFAGG